MKSAEKRIAVNGTGFFRGIFFGEDVKNKGDTPFFIDYRF